MRPPLAAALSLSISLTAALAAQEAVVDLPLARTRSGYLVVEVEADDATLRLAFDTGATQTMIAAERAARLGTLRERLTVTDVRGTIVEGFGGGPVVWRLGGRELVLPSVGWIPGRRELLPGAAELDGVLGADLLRGHDVWIDPRRGHLRLAPSGALAGAFDGTPVALETVGGRPALGIELLDLARRPLVLRLVVDSGSDVVVLFGAAAARVAAARSGVLPGTSAFATAHGVAPAASVPLGRAGSGGVALRLGPAVLLPEVHDREEDGLVPLDRLGPVLLSLAAGRAVLDARPRAAPTSDRELVARRSPDGGG